MQKKALFSHVRSSSSKKWFTILGMAIAFAVLQTLVYTGGLSSQLRGLLLPLCYNIILAVSLNLTVGILGDLSLGHAGFMCAGAFMGAFVSKCLAVISPGCPDWLRLVLAFAAGGLAAALFGFIVGIPVLRLQGDYVAFVTLAFGVIMWYVCSVVRVAYDSNGLHFRLGGTAIEGLEADAEYIVNGSRGIQGVGKMDPKSVGFIAAFLITAVIVLLCFNFIHSKAGRAVKSIRDNVIAAESCGISTNRYKLLTIVLSAFFAGIAGVLFTQSIGQFQASASNFGYAMSINILVFVVLGGMGSTLGSIIAAVVLTILPEWLRFLQDYRMLIYAVVLIGMMLFNASPKLHGWVVSAKKSIAVFFRKLFHLQKKEAAD